MTNLIFPLPLRIVGLTDIPAIPIQFDGLLDTLFKLLDRQQQIVPAKRGLSNVYSIGGIAATAHEFMYGVASPSATNAAVDEITTLMQTNPASVLTQLYQLAFNQLDVEKGDGDTGDLTTLSLDEPEQFSMSWTNFESVYENSLPLLPSLSASLTDADEATNQFWPTIARYGLQFNLLVLQKVATTDVAGLRNQFGRLGAQKDLGGMCCNFQKAASERLVGSIRLRLMHPPRTAC